MSVAAIKSPPVAVDIPARQIKKLRNNPVATAALVGLNYVKAGLAPGYLRKGKAPKFFYVDPQGNRCKDKEEVTRIKSLVLPPAWQQVWISVDPNAHLQATGIDDAGRKQYRYHPQWNMVRNHAKYYKLLTFADALPQLREQVERDLRKHNLDLNKSIALVIKLMDKTCIRVGNQRYKIKHGSSGITTLDAKCASITGSRIRFVFKGKKGVHQDITLCDPQLARLVKQYKEMPGKRLFQYINEHGGRCPLSASQVNDYIRTHTGVHFSAKDFRTWMGTVTAFEYLSGQEKPSSQRQFTRTINACLDVVAAHLGNTRAVCKKYYVHPAVFNALEKDRIKYFVNKEVEETRYFSPSEHRVKSLLSKPV